MYIYNYDVAILQPPVFVRFSPRAIDDLCRKVH